MKALVINIKETSCGNVEININEAGYRGVTATKREELYAKEIMKLIGDKIPKLATEQLGAVGAIAGATTQGGN